MFRVGKINGHISCCKSFTRQMSLARRLLNANQLQASGAPTRERTAPLSPTSQLSSADKIHKKSVASDHEQPTSSRWPRKIFSGIQPTGSLHLGNYLGAVRKWLNMQDAHDNITLCIVDMHSITMPHNPPLLRDNIFNMAATLLACGVDPAQCTLFVQSAVLEHSEFNWILSSLTTMPRLAQLPQFKEKSRQVRDVPLGLYVYPVLQAADIMLYKATHVPVGIDQLQHIQLAQHLARNFNGRYGEMFPVCTPVIEEDDGSRILSLRDTTKKMSKSDPNPKGTINLGDSPEQIKEKIKKAITDFTSDISYNPSMRPGVSNLINIHAHVTGASIATVVEEASSLDTAKYKERVADAVIEHLRPIREKIDMHLANRSELTYMLEMGADKARQIAHQTMSEVKQRLGLGTYANVPAAVHVAPLLPEHSKLTASQRLAKSVLHPDVNAHSQPHYEQRLEAGRVNAVGSVGGGTGDAATGELDMNQSMPPMRRIVQRPIVPVQTMRVEKSRNRAPSRHVFKMDTFNVPKIGFGVSSHSVNNNRYDQRGRRKASPAADAAGFGFSGSLPLNTVNSISGFKYGQSTNPSALASITNRVNAISKHQEKVSSLANSAFYKAAASSFNDSSPSVVNVAASTVRNKQKSTATTTNDNENSTSSSDQAEEDVEQAAEQQDEEDDSLPIAMPEATKMEN